MKTRIETIYRHRTSKLDLQKKNLLRKIIQSDIHRFLESEAQARQFVQFQARHSVHFQQNYQH